VNFLTFFAGRDESGKNHSHHAFSEHNFLSDFEPGFIGPPFERPPWCFLHMTIVTQVAEGSPAGRRPSLLLRRLGFQLA